MAQRLFCASEIAFRASADMVRFFFRIDLLGRAGARLWMPAVIALTARWPRRFVAKLRQHARKPRRELPTGVSQWPSAD